MTYEATAPKSHQEAFQQQQETTVDGFLQNKDGSSTLLITCADGKKVTFTVKTAKVKSLDADKIYETINKECGQ